MAQAKDKSDGKAITAGTINPPVKAKEGRKTGHGTHIVEFKYFPELLPFGVTTLRLESGKWAIKCGQFKLTGFGGDVEWIIPTFVEYVRASISTVVDMVNAEVRRGEFGKAEVVND